MKRLFAILLCLAMLFSLAACSDEKEDKKKDKEETTEKTEDKEKEIKGEYFDAGNVKAFVPKGWKAFAVADVFSEEENATDPDAITMVKGGKSELDMFSKPYLRIDYYGPDVEMMGGFEDFYEQTTPVEPIKLGTHNWQGFTTTDYGGVMAVLWSVEEPLEFQISIQLEVEGGDKISLEDKDVQKVLESIAASDGTVGRPATDAPPTDDTSFSHWDNTWYGWWCITDAKGDYAQFNGIAWDAYAITETDEDTGTITLWDTESSKDNPLMAGSVELTDTTMTLSGGTFFLCDGWLEDTVTTVSQKMTWGNWSVDLENSTVSHFDGMIEITGSYVDPTNNMNRFTYHIFLRPWGDRWEDVNTGDTSGCLYSDMMPLYYDDWYLPLLELGLTAPPDSFWGGYDLIQ